MGEIDESNDCVMPALSWKRSPGTASIEGSISTSHLVSDYCNYVVKFKLDETVNPTSYKYLRINKDISFSTKIKFCTLSCQYHSMDARARRSLWIRRSDKASENKCYRRMLGVSQREHKISAYMFQQVHWITRFEHNTVAGFLLRATTTQTNFRTALVAGFSIKCSKSSPTFPRFCQKFLKKFIMPKNAITVCLHHTHINQDTIFFFTNWEITFYLKRYYQNHKFFFAFNMNVFESHLVVCHHLLCCSAEYDYPSLGHWVTVLQK